MFNPGILGFSDLRFSGIKIRKSRDFHPEKSGSFKNFLQDQIKFICS